MKIMRTDKNSNNDNAHRDDLSLIESRYENQLKLQQKIRNLDASNEEIFEWYYSLDPLYEIMAHESLKVEEGHSDASLNKVIKHDIGLIETLAIGGSLVAHRAFNYKDGEYDPKDTKELISELSKKLGLTDQEGFDAFRAVKTLQYKLENNTQFVINKAVCDEIIIAADMLMIYHEKTGWHRSEVLKTIADAVAKGLLPSNEFERVELLFPNTLRCSLLSYDVISGLPDYYNNIIDDDIRILSLKASQRFSSMLMQESMSLINSIKIISEKENKMSSSATVGYVLDIQNEAMRTSRFLDRFLQSVVDQPISNVDIKGIVGLSPLMLIESIEQTYLGVNGNRKGMLLSETSIPKGTIKGDLYEAMWQLDFMMLKFFRSDILPYYRPAVNFEDSPKVGYPRLIRGYDGVISGNGYHRLVQLKSTKSASQKKGPQHPNIELVVEENFMEIEPRRLGKKLKIYKEQLTLPPNDRDVTSVMRYIMPTVLDAYNKAASKREPSQYGEALIRFTRLHYGRDINPATYNQSNSLNRADRRAAARKAKK